MTGQKAPPSQRDEKLFDYVKSVVSNRVSEYGGWPANLLKLELESTGIYQDFTGESLLELKDQDKIDKIEINGYPYAVGNSGTEPDGRIVTATEQFYQFVNSSRAFKFAELAVYAALSRVYDILSDHMNLDLLPKGEWTTILRGVDKEVDGLLQMRGENFPLEVYNGIDYLVEDRSDNPDNPTKLDQVEERAMSEPVQVNPVLVSRLTSEELRNIIRKMNGTVLDTGGIVACETNPNFREPMVQELNLSDRLFVVSEPTTSEGFDLDGETFDKWVTDRPGRILPEKLASAAESLPEPYIRRVRGTVSLLYVNQIYRKVSGRIGRIASLVVRYAYHRLLREGGKRRDEMFRHGQEDLKRNYRNFQDAKVVMEEIQSRFDQMINELREKRMIEDRDTGLYARGADHPHADLTFPKGREA